MGYMLRFRSSSDVEDYRHAGKKAKHGIRMIMDGIEDNNFDMIHEGAEMAWDGVKSMCEISAEMEALYGERRHDGFGDGTTRHNYRHYGEWNERDDEMMERRMRDSKGRYK